MKVLIFGATSAIAQATARHFAEAGDSLFLVGRNAEKLARIADDLRIRGASSVEHKAADLTQTEQHASLIQTALKALGGIDIVLIAHGVLGNQKEAEQDYQVAESIYRTNLLSVISLVTPIANLMEAQKRGTIAVISSVAGDRGRQSNYVYGSTKGGLNIYLQGLRNRLHPAGVQVVTLKPGFVDTPMTAGMKKNFLFAPPEQVAQGIYQAIRKGRNVVYLPPFWFWILLVVKVLPEFLFKRLKT